MDYVLVHYGIKGQRHGIRRFQNEDGSLTPAGRERYGKQLDAAINSTQGMADAYEEAEENTEERKQKLRKAEKDKKKASKKGIGAKTMAESKLLARKGANAMGLAKDVMNVGLSSAKAFALNKRAINTFNKMLNKSSNRDNTLESLNKVNRKKLGYGMTTIKDL